MYTVSITSLSKACTIRQQFLCSLLVVGQENGNTEVEGMPTLDLPDSDGKPSSRSRQWDGYSRTLFKDAGLAADQSGTLHAALKGLGTWDQESPGAARVSMFLRMKSVPGCIG